LHPRTAIPIKTLPSTLKLSSLQQPQMKLTRHRLKFSCWRQQKQMLLCMLRCHQAPVLSLLQRCPMAVLALQLTTLDSLWMATYQVLYRLCADSRSSFRPLHCTQYHHSLLRTYFASAKVSDDVDVGVVHAAYVQSAPCLIAPPAGRTLLCLVRPDVLMC